MKNFFLSNKEHVKKIGEHHNQQFKKGNYTKWLLTKSVPNQPQLSPLMTAVLLLTIPGFFLMANTPRLPFDSKETDNSMNELAVRQLHKTLHTGVYICSAQQQEKGEVEFNYCNFFKFFQEKRNATPKENKVNPEQMSSKIFWEQCFNKILTDIDYLQQNFQTDKQLLDMTKPFKFDEKEEICVLTKENFENLKNGKTPTSKTFIDVYGNRYLAKLVVLEEGSDNNHCWVKYVFDSDKEFLRFLLVTKLRETLTKNPDSIKEVLSEFTNTYFNDKEKEKIFDVFFPSLSCFINQFQTEQQQLKLDNYIKN